jgi:hypothetical protein
MQPKAQSAARAPRFVFVSWYSDGIFADPVWKGLNEKLYSLDDQDNRPIKLSDGSDRLGGDVNSVWPWDHTPTDVVVLLSDSYAKNFVGRAKIGDSDTSPLLNFLLRARRSSEPPPYDVWFGVVQNIPWENIGIEDKYLRDFEADLRKLHPKAKRFENDPKDGRVLDNAIADAVNLFCGFVTATDSDATNGNARADEQKAEPAPAQQPPTAQQPPAVPAPKAGLFRRLFRKG